MVTKRVMPTKKPAKKPVTVRKSVRKPAVKPVVRKPMVRKPMMRKPMRKIRRVAKHPSLNMKIKLSVNRMLRGNSSAYDRFDVGKYLLKNGDILEIDYSTPFESPRDWDNLGTFLTWDRNYVSPDKNPYSDPSEFFEEYNSKNAIIYFVDKYEHGGVKYSLTKTPTPKDRWDSAIVGVMYVPLDKVRKAYHVTNVTQSIRDKVKAVLQREIDAYNKWGNSEVYYFKLIDKDGEEYDSCYDIYDMETLFYEAGVKPSDVVREL